MPNSMTGFARRQIHAPWGDCSCEIRSVNHRHLELHIRLPESLRSLEEAFRAQLRSSLNRGKVEIGLQLNTTADCCRELNINKHLLQQLANAVAQVQSLLADTHPATQSIDPLALLQWPGVIDKKADDIVDITDTVTALFTDTLAQFVAHRQREGAELAAVIIMRLETMSREVAAIREIMPSTLRDQYDKLRQRLYLLTTETSTQQLHSERLEQEIVLLANKANIDEELDRLDTHIKEVKHILAQPAPMGRRLDFMMQELNREANTLSSKSLTSQTTQAAVLLKVLIEQMREQIQNIE